MLATHAAWDKTVLPGSLQRFLGIAPRPTDPIVTIESIANGRNILIPGIDAFPNICILPHQALKKTGQYRWCDLPEQAGDSQDYLIVGPFTQSYPIAESS